MEPDEEESDLSIEAPGLSAGLDLSKVADTLRAMAEQIAQLQSMLPQDAGEATADDVDQGAADGDMQAQDNSVPVEPDADDDGGKQGAKDRAAALIARVIR